MGSPPDATSTAPEGAGPGLPADWSAVAAFVEAAHAQLAHDLIGRIHVQPPSFFERLVIDVLLAMGYGSGRPAMARCLGRSWDGGIDGMILLDELGFDSIFVQAKRLKPGVAVPVSDVRDFAGSLEACRASKGVLVATTHFTSSAQAFCSSISRHIVLIDGARLVQLMIRHNIGVAVRGSFLLKELDNGYFRQAAERRAE
ncbi:MAG: restriction endonuclease [Aestuariivirga sp.]|uniref:restriction endonuclease n=1 Tax=Aestuariivirga sp. TaxID=2650926 RepID=UPI0038D168E3